MSAIPENRNLSLLTLAASKLAPLLDRIVFAGGCAAALLVTDAGAAPVRPTLDVDVIIEIATYAEFMALHRRMQKLGFEPSSAEGAPICRWTHHDLILDLMPTELSILGFSNRWYRPALSNATRFVIGDRLISAPYFLATKLDAFHGRGHEDYRVSHDLEDIVTVLDGRPEAVAEARESDPAVREIIARE